MNRFVRGILSTVGSSRAPEPLPAGKLSIGSVKDSLGGEVSVVVFPRGASFGRGRRIGDSRRAGFLRREVVAGCVAGVSDYFLDHAAGIPALRGGDSLLLSPKRTIPDAHGATAIWPVVRWCSTSGIRAAALHRRDARSERLDGECPGALFSPSRGIRRNRFAASSSDRVLPFIGSSRPVHCGMRWVSLRRRLRWSLTAKGLSATSKSARAFCSAADCWNV